MLMCLTCEIHKTVLLGTPEECEKSLKLRAMGRFCILPTSKYQPALRTELVLNTC